jgi:plasmid stabilization system protein ParE
MSRFVLSAEAELELNEIWQFIAQDNLDAADRWIQKLFAAFETLAHAPEWGTNART